MRYFNCCFAKFIERPNRFVAIVELDGKTETVHVKNTGRCKELLLPGARVVLVDSLGSSSPQGEVPAVLSKEGGPLLEPVAGEGFGIRSRKTRYDLIAVWKENLGWVNIDSQVPNAVVKEWLESGKSIFKNITYLKPEYKYGQSRVDFYLECGRRKILLEVKGCTLEIEGKGYFPDAPTLRGVKHLHELAGAIKEGYESYLAFVIAMPKVKKVWPNMQTHPEFGVALREAEKAGVKVLYLPCEVEPDKISCI